MKKLILAAAVCAGAISAPAVAQETPAEAKAGVRIEARVMWERLNDPDEAAQINYELGSGIGYGGEVGIDFAVSETVVVGPYVNYDISSVEDCEGSFCVSSGGYWAAGIQAGLVSGQNGLIYAKLGYGEQTLDVKGPLNIGGTIVNFDESETGGGYNFGLGYEHGFGPNFHGRVEMSVSNSSDLYGFDMQRTTLGVSLGTRF